MLVSRLGQSVRFRASNDELRPMGRATSGVKGMSFRGDDELLAADVILAGTADAAEDSDEVTDEQAEAEVVTAGGPYSFVVTEHGYAKRSAASAWSPKHRGGLGVKVATLTEERGALVGALLVEDGDEVLVIMESGKVVRSLVSEVPVKGKNSMGVIFAKPGKGDRVIGIARNVERHLDGDQADEAEVEGEAPVSEAAVSDTAASVDATGEPPAAE